MSFPVIVLCSMAAMVVAAVLLDRYIGPRRAKEAREAEAARLRSMPILELVEQARAAVRFERWERFSQASALLSEDQWSEEKLLRVLNELHVELAREDGAQNRVGRDSNAFEFHDCGLAPICDALNARTSDAS